MKTQKPTVTLTLLITIFFIPMIAAWLAYSKGVLLSNNTVNHGLLLTPPLSLSTLGLTPPVGDKSIAALKGKWALVYITQEPENSQAQQILYNIRQIRQATGKDRDRIERVIVSTNSNTQLEQWLKTQFPGTYHFIISKEKLNQLEANLPKKLALEQGSLYLVDPLGNIMLFYAPDALPKGILKDLQRVLKVSQIG